MHMYVQKHLDTLFVLLVIARSQTTRKVRPLETQTIGSLDKGHLLKLKWENTGV